MLKKKCKKHKTLVSYKWRKIQEITEDLEHAKEEKGGTCNE